MAARLALAKARSIDAPDAVVIGSDQVASLDGRLLRKPGGHAAALRQLETCQGRTVTFDTAVAVIDNADGRIAGARRSDRGPLRKRSTPRRLDRYVRARATL